MPLISQELVWYACLGEEHEHIHLSSTHSEHCYIKVSIVFSNWQQPSSSHVELFLITYYLTVLTGAIRD